MGYHAVLHCHASVDTCLECAPLLHQVTPEEDRARMVILSDPYLEHFDGYLELVEEDSVCLP